MLETITEIAQIRRCPDVVGPLAAAAADSGGFCLHRAAILLCLYGDLSHTRRAPRGKSQPAISPEWKGHAQSRVRTRQTQSKSQLRCREGRPTYRQR